jgi:hypothetical protein
MVGDLAGEDMCTVFCWVNLKQGDYFEDTGLDSWIIIKWILKNRFVAKCENLIRFVRGCSPFLSAAKAHC